jgi:hypothetical protein
MCIVALLLSIVSCAGADRGFERRLGELEARESMTSTKLTALAPLAGTPKRNQDGQPQVFEGAEPGVSEEVSNADCPSNSFALVRSETGTNCATYQAEISSFIQRCVDDCDAADLARRTVELGAARCSEFCTDKNCGARVTFIPPPQGCTIYNCFENFSECPDPACPDVEYCSLIHIDRVWNCFCRDLIPD